MAHFCLIRHGQTDWNIAGRYQGQTDIPLNEKGREQAHLLACQLKGQTFAAIYSSNLKRASETAEIIAACLHLSVTIEPRLREINQGEWEGQLVDDIKTQYAELWQMRRDSALVRPPGGETVSEVARRVAAALDFISNVHSDANVLIVSHGLALATVMCRVNGIPIGQAYSVIPENSTPVWIKWLPASRPKTTPISDS